MDGVEVLDLLTTQLVSGAWWLWESSDCERNPIHR